jgi:hypothetical protein
MDNPISSQTAPKPRFGFGLDDIVIVPLVALALAVQKLLRATLTILIHILDYAFPILLQVVRFPLYTLRILGDAIAALLKGVVRFLPMPDARRDAWRAFVSRHWSWLRQKLSYKAFEQAVHHAFERGMGWVFRTCRTLTPGGALLVIAGAALWLPISFGAATALHAVLLAKATVWPAWLQLLHPFATIIAKSKLLVLPAYPAAWPQAKKHALVQGTFRFFQFAASLHVMRKTAVRYRETEYAVADAGVAVGRVATRVGLRGLGERVLAGFRKSAAWLGELVFASVRWIMRALSRLPLVGTLVQSYATHYDGAAPQSAELLSDRVSGFFQRWSIKFSAEYYEAKDRSAAASNPQHA